MEQRAGSNGSGRARKNAQRQRRTNYLNQPISVYVALRFRSVKLKSAIRNSKFAILLGALLFALGFPAEGQQAAKVSRIGVLISGSPSGTSNRVEAFRQRLRELGYIEGQSIALEIRWAEGKHDRLHDLANELVRLKSDCIVTGSGPATQAIKKATSTIPVVMANDDDPVAEGHVASLARPGGNITGLASIYTELMGKRLELLKEVVPNASRFAVLWNASNPINAKRFRETEGMAQSIGVALHSLEVRTARDFDNALGLAAYDRVQGLIVLADALTNNHRKEIITLAGKNRLPAMYTEPEWVTAGGLMSYASDVPEQYRRAAVFVDKILKGAKPADLPVERPTTFELVINLKAAKAVGVTVPPQVLARADKVIR
jgi:putative ABC transport system substrate-binding protein